MHSIDIMYYFYSHIYAHSLGRVIEVDSVQILFYRPQVSTYSTNNIYIDTVSELDKMPTL